MAAQSVFKCEKRKAPELSSMEKMDWNSDSDCGTNEIPRTFYYKDKVNEKISMFSRPTKASVVLKQ